MTIILTRPTYARTSEERYPSGDALSARVDDEWGLRSHYFKWTVRGEKSEKKTKAYDFPLGRLIVRPPRAHALLPKRRVYVANLATESPS